MKRLIDPWNVFEDDYDQPLSGGFVYFYLTTTATKRNTYSDQALTVLNPNPMPLGSDGRLQSDVYATGVFTVRSVGTNGRTIESWPNVSSDIDAEDVTYHPPFSGSVPSDVETALARVVYVSDFDAALDGVTADDVPFGLAVSAASNSMLVIDGPMKLNASVTVPATVHVVAQGTITMATDQYFVAYKITHEKEGWQSGFNDDYDIRAFDGYPSLGSTVDSTPAINRAFTYIRGGIAGGGHAILNFRCRRDVPGTALWWCNTQPMNIDFHMSIRGEGPQDSGIYKNFVSATSIEGIFNLRPGATCEIYGFGLAGAAGSQSAGVGTGCLIGAVCTASQSVEFARLEWLVLTSAVTNATAYTLNLDGTPNISSAPGMRAWFITDVQCFGAETASVRMHGCSGFNAKFSGIASAGGTSGALLIDGTAGVPSGSNNITMAASSDISLGNCYLTTIVVGNLGGALTATADTVTTTVIGTVNGTVTNASASLRIIEPAIITTCPDTSAVNLHSSTVWLTTSGAAVPTLADGYEGQRMTFIMKTFVGNADLTPANFAGTPSAKITFDAVGDTAELLFTNGSWHWLGGSATVA